MNVNTLNDADFSVQPVKLLISIKISSQSTNGDSSFAEAVGIPTIEIDNIISRASSIDKVLKNELFLLAV